MTPALPIQRRAASSDWKAFFVFGLVEANNFQATTDILRTIFDEGISNLCLELELFFDQEKAKWIGEFSANQY